LSPEIDSEPPPFTEKADLPEELAYRLRQQRLTADFGYFALKTDNLDEILQEATRVAASGLNSPLAKVLEHMGRGQGFVVRAGVGWGPGVVGVETVGDDLESPGGYTFHTGKPLISNHLENEQRFRTPALLVQHGVKRAMNVIIQTDEMRFGVLEVDSSDQGKFDEADIAFLEGFATMMGVAIQRAQIDVALRQNQLSLTAVIRHQEVLTHEISHRVKNSLTVVSGLLAMQARTTSSEEVRRALNDARSRIQTIASIHDRLWRTDEVRTVNLQGFLSDLCSHLGNISERHKLLWDVDSVTIQTDQAITLGLLTNELITNSFKYAYGHDQGGHVQLSAKALGDGKLRFEVSDQGRGLPPNFGTTSSSSLGMRLIGTLSQQLGGTPEWANLEPGTRFTIEFETHRID